MLLRSPIIWWCIISGLISLSSGEKTFAVISDVHLNPFYNASYGPSSKCVSFANGGSIPNAAPNASCYAQFGCDTSPLLFQLTKTALMCAAKEARAEFLLILGDFVPHIIPMWQARYNASITAVRDLMESIIDHITSAFADLHIPLYPLLGNNDIYPEYDQPGAGRTAWLTRLSVLWQPFLSPKAGAVNATATFAQGGFYRVDLWHLNVSLLLLNTNSFSSSNNIANCSAYPDPDGVLEWLIAQLYELQLLNRTAWICGHISPSINHYSYQPNWLDCYSSLYYQIIANFSRTVGAQLFAHEHVDLFRATNVSAPLLLHGSISPIYGAYPSFRVYTIDDCDEGVRSGATDLDFTEYYWPGVNSTVPPSNFGVLFKSAVAEYGLSDISSDSVRSLVSRMQSSSSLFSKYWLNSVATAPDVPACNSTCVADQLCSTLYCDEFSYEACVAQGPK